MRFGGSRWPRAGGLRSPYTAPANNRRLLFRKTVCLVLVACFVLASTPVALAAGTAATAAQSESCQYWVAPFPAGNVANPGTLDRPWPTVEFAARSVPDRHCTVWVAQGIYVGGNHLVRRFETETTFKAVQPYTVTLQNDGRVLNFDGARNIVVEGFQFRHTGPGSNSQVVKVDRSGHIWSEHIVFRNNIFHDSYNDDLLKVYNGVRFLTVENNIFFNQAGDAEQIDINSVTDVTIQDNIFFNDYAGSWRYNAHDSKSFITVKDSNSHWDGQIGSERISIRRNIFLNWEGARETIIQIGNDGKSYHEVVGATVENNLIIGNGRDPLYAPFGARGVKDVIFRNNTVTGDLPSSSYGFWVTLKEKNPVNENVRFYNNIWSDPTRTMGEEGAVAGNSFSFGAPEETNGLALDNNLYWNGGAKIPTRNEINPAAFDSRRIEADPLQNENQSDLILPRWTGESFRSGSTSIRQEFLRLVETYGSIPAVSPAIGNADPAFAPHDDILGHARVGAPDIGAYQFYPSLQNGAYAGQLWWTRPYLDGAASAAKGGERLPPPPSANVLLPSYSGAPQYPSLLRNGVAGADRFLYE